MYCTQCGTRMEDAARYCPQCGSALSDAAPAGSFRQYPAQAPRRLFRLASDKKIGGVCSGIAYYLGMDVSFLRILYVAATIFTGIVPLVAAYVVAWIIVPLERPQLQSAPSSAASSDPSASATLVG